MKINWNYRNDEYVILAHAVQSGVKSWMEAGLDNETTPKHLRVGVNMALITSSALAKTLAEAGLISYEDFRNNEIELLKKEVESYEAKLSAVMGVSVHLK